MNILRELKRILPVTDLDLHVRAEKPTAEKPTLVPNFFGRRSIAPFNIPTRDAYVNRKAKEIRSNMSDTAGKIVKAAELVLAQTNSVAEFRKTVINITAKVYRNSYVNQTKLTQELEHHILRAVRIRHLIALQFPNLAPIESLQRQYIESLQKQYKVVFNEELPSDNHGRDVFYVDFTAVATKITKANKTPALAVLEHMLLKYTKQDGEYIKTSVPQLPTKKDSSIGLTPTPRSNTDSPLSNTKSEL